RLRMRHERLCAGSFRLGSRRFYLGSNTPRTLFSQQCERTGKVIRELFGGVVHGEMESYSPPPFQRFCSSGRSWSPGLLRHPPVDTLQEIAKLPRRDHHRPIGRRWPYEASPLQLLRKQAGSLAIVPDDLDQAAATPSEHE